MTKSKLIDALATILEVAPETIMPTARLQSFRLWDSTAGISMLVVFDENDVLVDEDRIRECETVQDLIDLAAAGRPLELHAEAEPVVEECP